MAEGAIITQTPTGPVLSGFELTFVPTPAETVVTRDLGGEVLLIDEATKEIHLLYEVTSEMWRRFDGKTDLRAVIDALAKAFDAPEDAVEDEVLELTEELANDGLLAGVFPPAGTDLVVGRELTPFRLQDLEGAPLDLTDLRGRQTLLVNWSPQCGYCRRIAGELAELEPALGEHDTELVFLASGGADANRALRDEHRLSSRIAVRPDDGDGFADPFPGTGTPVAYLLDAEGRVAEPLASGAVAVPALARRAAGLPEQTADTTESTTESTATAQYAPPGFARVESPRADIEKQAAAWRPTVAYELGEYLVGVRADTRGAEELAGRFLADHRLAEDAEAPAGYSLALGDNPARPSRTLKRLFQDGTTVVRSRSARRVLLGLAAYLSEYLPGDSAGLVRTDNVAVVAGGEALLLPADVADQLDQLEPRLTRLGIRLVDEPYASIDPEKAELVVLSPRVTLDRSVLDELEEAPSSWGEQPRVEPGRYPLRAWLMRDSEFDDAEATHAQAVYAAADAAVVLREEDELTPVVDALDRLLKEIAVVTLPDGGAGQVAKHVERYLAKG